MSVGNGAQIHFLWLWIQACYQLCNLLPCLIPSLSAVLRLVFQVPFAIFFLSCATLCVTLHSFLSLLITSNHVLVALYCTSPPLSFARLFWSTGCLWYLSSWNAQTISAYFPSVFWSCYQTSFSVLIVYCTLPGNFTHPYFCHMQPLLICIFWCPKLCLIQHKWPYHWCVQLLLRPWVMFIQYPTGQSPLQHQLANLHFSKPQEIVFGTSLSVSPSCFLTEPMYLSIFFSQASNCMMLVFIPTSWMTSFLNHYIILSIFFLSAWFVRKN